MPSENAAPGTLGLAAMFGPLGSGLRQAGGCKEGEIQAPHFPPAGWAGAGSHVLGRERIWLPVPHAAAVPRLQVTVRQGWPFICGKLSGPRDESRGFDVGNSGRPPRSFHRKPVNVWHHPAAQLLGGRMGSRWSWSCGLWCGLSSLRNCSLLPLRVKGHQES